MTTTTVSPTPSSGRRRMNVAAFVAALAITLTLCGIVAGVVFAVHVWRNTSPLCPPPNDMWHRTHVETMAWIPFVGRSEVWENPHTEEWMTCFEAAASPENAPAPFVRYGGRSTPPPHTVTLLSDDTVGVTVLMTEGHNAQDGRPYREYQCKLYTSYRAYALFYRGYENHDWATFVGACAALAHNVNRNDALPRLNGLTPPQ